ncbi:MAG: heavy-metal-associated domain-containing protein, partial [Prevotella sp.]|nr:heavy-metal-associated domain-containing protein [Prevotella sp.]
HQKEEETMTKTMKIEGMMCEHCEARVKKVLEALPEVDPSAPPMMAMPAAWLGSKPKARATM